MSSKELIKANLEVLRDGFLHMLPIIGAFFAPALYVILLVFLITIVDTYTGRKAARYLGKPITTNRFSDLFAKLIGYAVFICIGLLLNLITQWPYFVWLASIVPIHTELSSINENQVAMKKKGIFKQLEDAYKFALNIKKKRDELR